MCRVTPPGYVQEYGDTRAIRILAMLASALPVSARVGGRESEHGAQRRAPTGAGEGKQCDCDQGRHQTAFQRVARAYP